MHNECSCEGVGEGVCKDSWTYVQIYNADTDGPLVRFFIHQGETYPDLRARIDVLASMTGALIFDPNAMKRVLPQYLNFETVTWGEILLVTSNLNKNPQPYPPKGYSIYLGEESADVDPALIRKSWTQFTDDERFYHVNSLRRRKPVTRKHLRITRTWATTKASLKALDKANPLLLVEDYSPKDLLSTIVRNWGVALVDWVPEHVKPVGVSAMHDWMTDQQMLAAVAILAKATSGQSDIVKEDLEKLDKTDRYTEVLVKERVVKLIEHIYERARMTSGPVIR